MKHGEIAVILSGCGKSDGTEIHEAVLTLLAIDMKGFGYKIFAPDITQSETVNHLTNEVVNEERNVLVESARIARGDIYDIKELNVDNFAALIIPGGFGAAKNLSSFAFDGVNFKVNAEVESVIKQFHSKQKPIGALCIAPVIIAKILGNNVSLTIGNDKTTAKVLRKLNANHIDTYIGEIEIDKKNKIVTTPCYMLDTGIHEVFQGVNSLVKEITLMLEFTKDY